MSTLREVNERAHLARVRTAALPQHPRHEFFEQGWKDSIEGRIIRDGSQANTVDGLERRRGLSAPQSGGDAQLSGFASGQIVDSK